MSVRLGCYGQAWRESTYCRELLILLHGEAQKTASQNSVGHYSTQTKGEYKLAQEQKKNLASICLLSRDYTDPPVTKIRLWASFGV